MGDLAAQCFAWLHSLGVGTFPIQSHRSLGKGIKVRKAYCFKKKIWSQTDITKGMCQVIQRWTREEQARRECNPNQSPDTWKTYVRAPFVVSIDIEQLDFEDQSGVWWDDRWKSTGSIPLHMLQNFSCTLSVKLRT